MTRAVVVVVLLGAVLLTGLFARREWVPYVYVLRSIADFYRDDYEGTVADSTQALFLNRNSADGYFYRARAYNRLGKHEKAILDFDHLVDSGSALPTDYLYRAEAYQVLGNLPAACADLRTALEAHRWRLGETAKGKALDTWEQLECDSFEDMVREGDGS